MVLSLSTQHSVTLSLYMAYLHRTGESCALPIREEAHFRMLHSMVGRLTQYKNLIENL